MIMINKSDYNLKFNALQQCIYNQKYVHLTLQQTKC